jgi:phosphoglycolate phosphatase
MERCSAYHAALFDLDGTLADTLVDVADAVNSVLSSEGLPIHPADAYRTMVGNGFSLLMRRALPPGFASEGGEFERLLSKSVERYREGCLVSTAPYPGINKMLDILAAAGIPTAVLSNKPHSITLSIVGALFPNHHFATVYGERPGVPTKPDPHAALDIASLSNIAPSCWLYLGDSGVDMATARAAGMTPVGALWGFRDKAELLAMGASLLVTKPSEVLALFGFSD